MNAAEQSKQVQSVNRIYLHGFLAKQAGKFVTVEFTKLDGSNRMLNGRLGVRKHLRGGTNTVMAPDRPYLTVFDVKRKGYRAVNLSTVSKVRAENACYTIVD